MQTRRIIVSYQFHPSREVFVFGVVFFFLSNSRSTTDCRPKLDWMMHDENANSCVRESPSKDRHACRERRETERVCAQEREQERGRDESEILKINLESRTWGSSLPPSHHHSVDHGDAKEKLSPQSGTGGRPNTSTFPLDSTRGRRSVEIPARLFVALVGR